MKYICECGKEFESPNSFNGHKSHCKIHLEKTGKLNLHIDLQDKRNKKAAEARHKKADLKKLKELSDWIAEEHICEKCGKVMTEKYGSGRFCSRACANSRIQTDEINQKRSLTCKKNYNSNNYKNNKHLNNKHLIYLNKYELNPKFCPICNTKIPYNKRRKNTCGRKECEHEFRSYKCSLAHKEGRNKGWIKRNTLSFPEKFWISILDNNNIKYEKQVKVVYSEKSKYYFLDFVINNKIDLEIDGGQHLLPENQKRDKERDEFVNSLGYIVYRIPWKGTQDKELIKNQINNLLLFIQNVV